MRRYYLFQLPSSNPKIFRHYSDNVEIDLDEYVPVYTEECGYMPDLELCEKLFEKFNINHPVGFAAHSMSTSDIVMIKDGADMKFYYCDAIGFILLNDKKNFKKIA